MKIVPIEFIRGVLGVIAVGCVYMMARSVVAVRHGRQKVSTLYGWIIRATVCLLAMAYRHAVDTVQIAVWAAAAVVFAAGYWEASRAKKEEEDLTHQIFPDSPDE